MRARCVYWGCSMDPRTEFTWHCMHFRAVNGMIAETVLSWSAYTNVHSIGQELQDQKVSVILNGQHCPP